MQTVTLIQPGASAGAGAKDQPDTAGEDGAFPATLRQALSGADGKASPPAAGKSSPPPDLTGAAPVDPTRPESAVVDNVLPNGVAPAEPLDPAVTAAATTHPAESTTEAAAPVPAEVPGIAAALQDIAAGRRAANHPDPAPMRPDTPADSAEPALAPPVDVAAAHKAQPGTTEDEPAPDATTAQGLPTDAARGRELHPVTAATAHAREVVTSGPAAARASGLLGKASAAGDTASQTPDTTSEADKADAVAPRAPEITIHGKAGAPEAANAGVPSFGGNGAPTPSATDVAAQGTAALMAATGNAAPTTAPTTAPVDTSPRALPELNIAAPPGSPQFGPELGERLLWLVRDGLHEARLQLNPRELGPVEVRLSVGDGGAQLSFSAQHAGTVAAVQQSLPQLRDLLAQQGLQLGQANVFHQPAGDGEAARQQHTPGSGNPSGWGSDRSDAFDDGLPAPTARLIGRGLVDAYA
ncbi:MAG: flagellar hook-length control protein FliK [Pseudomonadota bacterium]